MPLALFQDGKAYSIVTDHLGTLVEAYNEQGEEVWYRRLDMNGKVIEERSIKTILPTRTTSGYRSFSKDSTMTKKSNWHTTGSDIMTLNLEGISRKILYASPAEQRLYIAMLRILILGLIHLAYELEILLSYRRNFIQEQSLQKIQEEYIEFLQVEIIMMIKLRCTQKQGYQNLLVQITLHIILVTILTQIQWKCNLFEAKAIRNYHIEEVLKIMKSKLEKNTNEIVMLNNSFIDKITNKKVIGRKISYENIVLFFCEWEFPGKDEYMEFLLQFNGLFFPDGLILKSDLDVELEVETLYDVNGRLERYWDIAKKNPDLPDDFTTRHIPIGNDAAGNQYWVDLFSGKILFFETEYDFPEGLHVVSDCFCTFYSNLRPM